MNVVSSLQQQIKQPQAVHRAACTGHTENDTHYFYWLFEIILDTAIYTESGLKLPGLDLASLATQGVCTGAQPNVYTGYDILYWKGTHSARSEEGIGD